MLINRKRLIQPKEKNTILGEMIVKTSLGKNEKFDDHLLLASEKHS